MLLLSYPMRSNDLGTSIRRYAFLYKVFYLVLLLIILSTATKAQVVSIINSEGGTSATDGLRIEVNGNGTFVTYRKGKVENIPPAQITSGQFVGIKATFRTQAFSSPSYTNPISVPSCNVSPVMGTGSASDPYKVFISGVTTYNVGGYEIYLNVITILTYVNGNNYYTLDYIFYAPMEGDMYPRLYLAEYLNMQDTYPTSTLTGNKTEGLGLATPSGAVNMVGFTRQGGTNVTPGSFSHTFHAYNQFNSYYARYASEMETVLNGSFVLQNQLAGPADPGTTRRGMGVEVQMDYKSWDDYNQATGTRVAVGYTDDVSPSHINMTDVTATGSTQISLVFANATAEGDEGNLGSTSNANIKLKVVGDAVVKVPLFIKMELGTADPTHPAIEGTDFNFTGGFIIPANSYHDGDLISINNIKIIGNNILEYGRKFTVKLVSLCSNEHQLVKIDETGITSCVYTIKDDEPKDITLTGSDLTEGLTGEHLHVALPPGVLASEATTVAISITGGTATLNDDFTYNVSAVIPKDANGVDIPITAKLDKVLEAKESIELKAQATVMGETQTSSLTIHIKDATRLDPTLTKVSLVKPDNSLLKEGFDGTVTIKLPDDVTTDLPINVTITRDPASTATVTDDYTLPTTAIIPAGAGSVDLNLKLIDDALIEGLESLHLSLAGSDEESTTYTGDPDVIDITDAQLPMTNAVALHISANTVDEGATTDPQISAELPAGINTAIPIKVFFNVDPSSTVESGQYSYTNFVTIAPGNTTSNQVNIHVPSNMVFDDGGVLKLVGAAENTDVLVDGSVTLTIVDKTDPSKRVLTLAADETELDEGNKTALSVSFPTGYSSAKDIEVTLAAGPTSEAESTKDFTPLTSITLANKQNTVKVTDLLSTHTDQVIEKDEQLVIIGTTTVAGYTIEDATVKILDQTRLNTDNTKLTFTAPATPMPEDADQTISYALPSGITTEIPITISLSGTKGTAISGTDYVLPASATLSSGNGGSVTLQVKPDILVESDETLNLGPEISDAHGTAYSMATDTLRMTIKDAQYPFPAGDVITLSASPDQVSEGASTVITATLPNGWKAGKDWDILLAKDIAASVADARHTTLPTKITITENTASAATAPITINTNNVFDDEGIVKVDDNTGNADMPASSAVINIADATDITQKKFTLTTAATLNEGAKAGVTISLPAGYSSAKDVEITLGHDASSEAATSDYSTPAKITLGKGKNSDVIADVITAGSDDIIEKDETLQLTGTATGYTVAGPATQILDQTRLNTDNTKLTFTAPATPMPEDADQTISYALPSGITTEIPITISLSGTRGTAISGTDYVLPASATLSSGNGGSVTLQVKPDILVEGDETLNLGPEISDAHGTIYSMATDTLRMTIKDAQYPFPAGDVITLSASPDPVSEGASTVITATLPNGWKAGKDWDILLTKDMAASVADARHTTLPAKITITENTASAATAPITINTNNVFDDEGIVKVDDNTGNADMPASSAVINITDATDITQKKFTLTTSATLNEGAKVGVTISLPAGYSSAKDVEITLGHDASSEAATSDYSTPAKITLGKGKNSDVIADVITAGSDDIIEKDETLQLTGTATGYTVAGPATQILDQTRLNTDNTKLTFTAPATPMPEDADQTISYALPSGITTEIPITISLSGTKGTAIPGTDYVLPASATLSSGNGGSVTLQVKPDILVEGDETLNLGPDISDAHGTGYSMATDTLRMTIKDAQYPFPAGDVITLSASPDPVSEGASTVITATLPNGWKAGKDWDILLAKDMAASVADARHTTLPAKITITENTASAATAPITINTNNVFDDEGIVKVDDNTGNADMPASSAVINITDATDITQKKFTLTTAATLNEGAKAGVTISLPAGYSSAKDVEITLGHDASSEAATSDYSTPAKITLGKGKTSDVIADVITAGSDDIIEKDETLQLTGTATGYTVAGPATKILDQTRLNTDNTKLTFTAPAIPMPEDADQTISYALPSGITTEIPITISLSGTKGTAISGTDYVLPASATLSSGNGGSVTLQVKPDILVEGDETLNLGPEISDAHGTGYSMATDTLRMTIKDAQYPFPAGDVVTLSSTPDSIYEGASSIITATLPNGWKAGKDWVINLDKNTASTVADARHTAVPATLIIKEGNASAATSNITAYTNNILDDEGKILVDANTGNTDMPGNSASIYIKDQTEKQPNARKLALTPATTTIAEGNKYNVTVTAPYASTKPVTVQFSVAAGSTATLTNDYTISNTAVTLAPGETTKTIELLDVLSDNVLEANETVNVHATVNGYTINDAVLTISDVTRTIATNREVTMSTPLPVNEGDTKTVTFSLPAGITTEVPITINLSNITGTAEAGLDYAIASGVTLSSGNSTTTSLQIKTDNLVEGPETIVITPAISDAFNSYTASAPVLTIADDPAQYPIPAPVILKSTLANIDEGASTGAVLSAQLPNNLQAGRDITIRVTKDAASTTVAADHTVLPSPYDIVIPKGQNIGQNAFALKALKDLVLEDDETVVFTGAVTTAPFTAAVVKDTTITIKDRTHDDPATGLIHLTAVTTGTHVQEGSSYTMKVSLATGVTSSKDIKVGLAIGTGSVAKPIDIDQLPDTVVIPAGQPSVNFTFAAKNDFVIEKPELLWITATPNLTGMQGDKLSVTIDDVTGLNADNRKMEWKIDSSLLHEGSASAVTYGFVNSQIVSDEDVIVNITQHASSTAEAADYSGIPAQTTLKAGDHSTTASLQITDDNVLEGDEQLQLAVQLVTTGYTITQPGLVLIPETGDMRVQVLKAADAAEPATNGAYTVKLPGNTTAAADVKVVYYVSSLTGTTNIAPIATSATILAGENSVSVPVKIIDNKVIDGDETVSVSLMLAQMRRFNKNIPLDVNDKDTVNLIVFDDESKAPGREMVIEKISDAAEPSITGTFRVHFADAAVSASKQVDVAYTISGTATAGTRYQPLSGTVAIPAGQNGADIQVVPIDNSIVEGNETVITELKAVSSSMAGITWPISATAAATMNIQDNDTLVVDLTAAVTTTDEGKAITFKLTSPSTPAHDIPIRVQVAQDAVRTFTTSEGIVNSNIITVMMPANSKDHTFTITAKDNEINDDNGFLKAEILPYLSGSGSLIYKAGTNDKAEIEITDNDPLSISFTADKFSVKEGNLGEDAPLYFNVQLSRQSSRTITVNYDFEESTDGVSYPKMDFKATPGVDFDNAIKQFIISPLQSTAQLAVNIKGDTVFEQNETFIVKLLNATVPSGQNTPTLGTENKATGVILNDDPMCNTCDTDGDGLTDGQEDINKNGDPFDDDTDGDGIPNFLDLDSDGDGVSDSVEKYATDNRVVNNNSNKIRVHPAISPNNDGQGNDAMFIENIEKYPDNEVVIFNRWGGTVFKMKNYDNKSKNFRGRANAGGNSGNDVADGSYFYNIEVVIDGKKEHYTGFIVIKR